GHRRQLPGGFIGALSVEPREFVPQRLALRSRTLALLQWSGGCDRRRPPDQGGSVPAPRGESLAVRGEGQGRGGVLVAPRDGQPPIRRQVQGVNGPVAVPE